MRLDAIVDVGPAEGFQDVLECLGVEGEGSRGEAVVSEVVIHERVEGGFGADRSFHLLPPGVVE